MPEKFRNKYRIPSSRLKNWDYGSNASYFLTICTHNRVHYFGDVVDKKMNLSDVGKIAEKFWCEIPQHFPFVELGAFVVMPDHVHGILIFNKNDDGTRYVETPNLGVSTTDAPPAAPSPATQKWNPASLGVIINQYKRICTINARKIQLNFAWQSRFHDHIIRDDESFQRISDYIIANPDKWKDD